MIGVAVSLNHIAISDRRLCCCWLNIATHMHSQITLHILAIAVLSIIPE